MQLEVSKHVWTSDTRPCHFCLCLQDGSVFADFNLDSDGRAYVVRISFDGWGCYPTAGQVTRLSLDESQTLIKQFEADDVNCDEVREILYHYFDQNKNVFRRDALEQHELLKW